MDKIKFLCITTWYAPVIFVWAPGRKGFWGEFYYREGRPQVNRVTAVLAECPFLADEYDSPAEAIAAVPQNASNPNSPHVLAFASIDAVAEYLGAK